MWPLLGTHSLLEVEHALTCWRWSTHFREERPCWLVCNIKSCRPPWRGRADIKQRHDTRTSLFWTDG
jgi:hypothetical protein